MYSNFVFGRLNETTKPAKLLATTGLILRLLFICQVIIAPKKRIKY